MPTQAWDMPPEWRRCSSVKATLPPLHMSEGEFNKEFRQGRMAEFYRLYVEQEVSSENITLTSDWQTVQIGHNKIVVSAKELTGQWEFKSRKVFDTGWWLHGAHDVEASGTIEVKCTADKWMIRNRDVSWFWNDEIKSNPTSDAALEKYFFHTWEYISSGAFGVVIGWQDGDTTESVLKNKL